MCPISFLYSTGGKNTYYVRTLRHDEICYIIINYDQLEYDMTIRIYSKISCFELTFLTKLKSQILWPMHTALQSMTNTKPIQNYFKFLNYIKSQYYN